jgi:hypothetical protein
MIWCSSMIGRILLILFTAATALPAGGFLDQFWPEANVYVNTRPRNSRLFFVAAGTR